MTNEEAIVALKNAAFIGPPKELAWTKRAVEMAIESLERKIPKKPQEIIEDVWGIKSKENVCPDCGADIVNVQFFPGSSKHLYCWQCGQAIEVIKDDK